MLVKFVVKFNFVALAFVHTETFCCSAFMALLQQPSIMSQCIPFCQQAVILGLDAVNRLKRYIETLVLVEVPIGWFTKPDITFKSV